MPIPRVVADALEPLVAGRAPNELVFTAPYGAPLRSSLFRRRFWQPACIAAGLGRVESRSNGTKGYEGLRIHLLRHTAVALWIAAGASPLEIARRAGHTSVSVVLDRYGHLLPGSEDVLTDALDAVALTVRDATVCDIPVPSDPTRLLQSVH